MRPALVVLDIQNVWLEQKPELKKSVDRRINVINGAIAWFRRAKLPVIVVCHEDREMGVVPGTRDFEIYSAVAVEKTDPRITKQYPNSFGKTDLEGLLRKLGRDSIVIVGLSASECVLGTYFGAWDWNIHPYILKGGIASHNEDHVRAAEDICQTTSLDALEKEIAGK
ncbi:MAG: cysteine hydrolase [Thermoplasmata archaeon]|jgi:nicotinamidase-related amidase|nr:cysteine hydrolase [Thermoplasmata archaeon]